MSASQVKHIWILTLFPELFTAFLENGIAGSAFRGDRGPKFEFHFIQIRDFSVTNYKGVDDAPYGGGAGMVMRADVLKNAIFDGVIGPGNYGENWKRKLKIIFPNQRGTAWNNQICQKFSQDHLNPAVEHDLVFICGRYEGIDERFLQKFVDLQYSIGDYILTGGEVAVISILDSAIRFVPGSLGNAESLATESFNDELLEHPQYTRPRDFEGDSVPEVLVGGNHKKIKIFEWSERERLTKSYRPDLWDKHVNRKNS